MVILDKKFTSLGFSGLYDLGNTCYINAVVQVLSNVVLLTKYFHNNDLEKFHNNKYYNVSRAYQTVVIELWKENVPLSPKSFKRYLDSHFEKYKNDKNHDALEFLLDLLECFNVALSKKTVDIRISDFSSKHYNEAKRVWREYFKNNSSIISELFYGQFMKEYKCKVCFNVYYSYDIFSPFIVSSISKNKVSIKNLINLGYYQRDYIQSTCKRCSEKYNEEHEVTTRIYKLPEVLTIVIKRFNSNLTKNKVNLEIDEVLDLSDITATSTDESVFYDISGMVCHQGDALESGHYYAIIKRSDAYYCFDNAKIFNFDIKAMNGSEPYILMYTRRTSK
jgi:ubiquitin C-terminal hydrolase